MKHPVNLWYDASFPSNFAVCVSGRLRRGDKSKLVSELVSVTQNWKHLAEALRHRIWQNYLAGWFLLCMQKHLVTYQFQTILLLWSIIVYNNIRSDHFLRFQAFLPIYLDFLFEN